MDIRTCKEALALGLDFYFTGRPCCHGHVAERSVTTRHCRRCEVDRNEAARKTDRRVGVRQSEDERRRLDRIRQKERFDADPEAHRSRLRESRARAAGFASRAEWEIDRAARALARKAAAAEKRAAIEEKKAFFSAMAPDEKKARQRAQVKEWLKSNPEKRRVQRRNDRHVRRARIKGNGGSITAKELEALRSRHGKRCAYCGARGRMTIDHIVPLARGGTHEARNIQFLCAPCNSAKRDLDAVDGARLAGLLV